MLHVTPVGVSREISVFPVFKIAEILKLSLPLGTKQSQAPTSSCGVPLVFPRMEYYNNLVAIILFSVWHVYGLFQH